MKPVLKFALASLALHFCISASLARKSLGFPDTAFLSKLWLKCIKLVIEEGDIFSGLTRLNSEGLVLQQGELWLLTRETFWGGSALQQMT